VSLKNFHFLFIGIALVITAGFGYWALRDFSLSRSLLMAVLGAVSLLCTIGLAFYLFWFIRKAKTLPA
jgi:hypothetical protein